MPTSIRMPGHTLSRTLPSRDAGAPVKRSQGAQKAFRLAAGVIADAGQVAAGMAGGPLAAQLVGRVNGAAGLGTGTLNGGLGGALGTGDDGFGLQMQLLELQRKIQAETQVFQTLSNTSKAEHDARMSAVRNIRP